MGIVDVVHMVPVRNRRVPAVGSVSMLVGVVDHMTLEGALVPVACVRPMGVAVVEIVGMVPVPDDDVAAGRTVVVAVALVGGMKVLHAGMLPQGLDHCAIVKP
jgi:hypothetical protein